MSKLDIFQQVLDSTTGEDLAKVLWLKSKTADVWVERRASFTKSVAVMSMVGYILGLGDRHLANLMLHKVSTPNPNPNPNPNTNPYPDLNPYPDITLTQTTT